MASAPQTLRLGGRGQHLEEKKQDKMPAEVHGHAHSIWWTVAA